MTTLRGDSPAESIRARDGDGSLGGEGRAPSPLGPDSLVWKYFGDRRSLLLVGRAGTTENMYPQLGQAVSDHSVIFTGKEWCSYAERTYRGTEFVFEAGHGEFRGSRAVRRTRGSPHDAVEVGSRQVLGSE